MRKNIPEAVKKTILLFSSLHLLVLFIDAFNQDSFQELSLVNILDLPKIFATPALFNTLWFSILIYGVIFSIFYLSGKLRK